jgi:hypothetical protein
LIGEDTWRALILDDGAAHENQTAKRTLSQHSVEEQEGSQDFEHAQQAENVIGPARVGLQHQHRHDKQTRHRLQTMC